MVIDEKKNLVEPPAEDCECKFVIGEDGRPVVLCADEESQERAVRSMQEGDVVVRVNPVVDHDGDHDDGDHDGDVEESEELELGFAGDLDDAEEEE